MQQFDVCLGWTTTATKEDAERLARGLVEARLAACVQIDGPITSVYRWQGAVEEGTEYRLCVKFARAREKAIGAWLTNHHSYETPEWVVCPIAGGAEKYLNWVIGNSS